jgi:hypothetical protein
MGRAIGQVATAAGAEAAIESTAYTEPTVGAQRSLKSSNAADTAAGTGARTVRITYYSLAADGTVAGPFTEIVVLNGVTAVPTVALNIALIEKMEVLTAGAGGVAAGTLTLTVDNAGAGATIGTIAAGARQTLWAHHYVPTGGQCRVADLSIAGGDAAAAAFSLRSARYLAAGVVAPELELTGSMLANNATSPPGGEYLYPVPPLVAGPARIRAYVTPANANAQTSRLSFGYVDSRVGFGS